jgi:hypothetical protein
MSQVVQTNFELLFYVIKFSNTPQSQNACVTFNLKKIAE